MVNAWQVYEDGYDLCRPQNGDPFSFDTSLLLTIYAHTIYQESFKEEMSLDEAANEFSIGLDMALVIKKLVSQRQNAYATSIAEDTLLLQNARVKGRLRMAIEVRLGEKQILAMALDCIQKKIEDLNQELSTSPNTEFTNEATITKRRKL